MYKRRRRKKLLQSNTSIVNKRLKTMEELLGCPISEDDDLRSSSYDGVIMLDWPNSPKMLNISPFVCKAVELDQGLITETAVLSIPDIPGGRLVHSPTGPIDPDYDDVRIFKEAAGKGIKRAIKAGMKRPLLMLRNHPGFKNCELITLLGALEALYVPLEVREFQPTKSTKVEYMGVWSENLDRTKQIVALAKKLESGLYVARDIGGSDPERMAPPKVKSYVTKLFANSPIKVTVVDDVSEIEKNYPLFEAVNRAASIVDRHKGCIIFLEYTPPSGQVKDTVMLVGKGVTYDTGGADIKAGGIMAGMSRDKCGAAAVAGFMQVVREMQPKDVKVIAGMSMVRNSVGSNCYVADEILTARSGMRVRVGNTDAEGRMVMADVLCRMKELAVNEINPHLYTVATLTGHAVLAVGKYAIVLDNGPARKSKHGLTLQERAHDIGDPFEISTLRKEDISFHHGQAQGDDVHQCNNLPSSRTSRGHQGPGGFLLLASGLDKYGSGTATPLKYSHLDIAGAAGDFPNDATGSPVLALANMYLLRN